MATYKQIQTYIHKKYGYVPQTCWIAHVKELSGLPIRQAHNRHSELQQKPCPPDKQQDIREAFDHFEMLNATSNVLATLRHAEVELPFLATYSADEAEAALHGDSDLSVPDWLTADKPEAEESRFLGQETLNNLQYEEVGKQATEQLPDWLGLLGKPEEEEPILLNEGPLAQSQQNELSKPVKNEWRFSMTSEFQKSTIV